MERRRKKKVKEDSPRVKTLKKQARRHSIAEGIFASANILVMLRKIAKHPQPGHHFGSQLDRHVSKRGVVCFHG